MRWFSVLLKPAEVRRVTGATFMLVGALACLLLFGSQAAGLAVLFLALGDPAAALVGVRAKGPRVWGKSPVGTAAFVVVALAGAAVARWLGLATWRPALVVAAMVAAAVELLPLPVDDNLVIPLVTAFVLSLAGM